MARVKGAMMTRKRRKKVLKLAKGYFGGKSRLFKTVGSNSLIKDLIITQGVTIISTVSVMLFTPSEVSILPLISTAPTKIRIRRIMTCVRTFKNIISHFP